MSVTINNTPTEADGLPTILWDNLFLKGTLAASTEAAGYPKENAVSENTFKSWKPTAIPATLSVDLGSAMSCDSFAIVAHNCFTNGNTIQFQSSTNNSTWTTRCTVTPTDNTTIIGLFNSVSARYWRINITTGTAPVIGVLFAAARLTLPGGVKPPYTPLWQSQTYELLEANSLGGNFFGNRVLRKGTSTAIELVSFTRTYAETTLQPFREHYNIGKAFIWAAGPSIFSKDVGYVWRQNGSVMAPTFDEDGNWMSVGMEVNGYGE